MPLPCQLAVADLFMDGFFLVNTHAPCSAYLIYKNTCALFAGLGIYLYLLTKPLGVSPLFFLKNLAKYDWSR